MLGNCGIPAIISGLKIYLQLSLQECTKLKREGLYICMIKNPNPVAKNVTPQLSDAAFIREKVPMTKEEIRHVSICKLHLKRIQCFMMWEAEPAP